MSVLIELSDAATAALFSRAASGGFMAEVR